MAADIGAKIGIDGEKAFQASLSAINSQMKALGSEMKAVTASFAGMEDSEDAAAAKTDVLGRSLEAANQKLGLLQGQSQRMREKLSALGTALENARQEFGENSVAAQRAQNAYNKQAAAVNILESQMNQTRAEISRMEREMRDAGNAADRMGDELEGAGREADAAGSAFRGAFSGSVITGAIKSLASGISSLISGAMEYNKIMGTLETSSQRMGYAAKETEESFLQLYSVLGDTQTAATAAANLQALGLKQEQLQQLTEGAIGAWAAYGDSIPIDGLAEAINETIRVGEVTGTFADMLNWAGTSEDAFNEKLAAAGTEAERVNLVLQEMANQGLMQTAEAWRQNNAGLVSVNQAAAQFEQATGQLGTLFLPAAAAIKGGIAEILTGFLALVEGTRTGGMEFVRGLVDGIVSGLPQMIETAGQLALAFIEGLQTNFPPVLTAGVEMLGELLKGIIQAIPSLVAQLPQIILAITGFLKSALPQLMTAGVGLVLDLISGILSAIPDLVSNLPAIIEAIVTGLNNLAEGIIEAGAAIIEGLWEGIRAKSQWLQEKIAGVIDTIKAAFTSPSGFDIHSPALWSVGIGTFIMQGLAMGLREDTSAVKSAEESAEEIKEAFTEEDIGAALVQSVKDGIESSKSEAEKAAEEFSRSLLQEAEKYVEGRKFYNQLSLDEEIAFWEDIRELHEFSAAEIEAIDRKIYTGRQELLEEERRLFEEQEEALKKYEESVASKAERISGFTGLFEAAEAEEVTGKELLENLESQIAAIAAWRTNLEELQAKGVTDGLLEELRELGPNAAGEIAALNTLTEEELERYIALYQEKQKEAQEIARTFAALPAPDGGLADGLSEGLGEGLTQGVQLEAEIDSTALVHSISAAAGSAIQATSGGMMEAFVQGMTEQEPALLDYIDELKEAVISLIESYWANFREVGEDMMLGLAQGIRDGRSEVVNAIAAAVQAALERARNDLGIRSPSRAFAEMGEYSMEGFALGMKNRLKAAVQTVSEGMHALASAAPAAAQPAANSYTYGDTVVYVDTVNASDPKDIERMAYQLEFYRRQIASGRGNLYS